MVMWSMYFLTVHAENQQYFYLANLSIFPDCSRTSQTHATCSWVKPKEAMPEATEGVISDDASSPGGVP